MNIRSILSNAYAAPGANLALPVGPYRFVNREFLIITYCTDPAALRALVPDQLEIDEPLVHYHFSRMPDATCFGDYTESGQVVPVTFEEIAGNYLLSAYPSDHLPTAGSRARRGFSSRLPHPALDVYTDTLVGTLDYGPVRIATGTMGYKHQTLELAEQRERLEAPYFRLHATRYPDGSPQVCELVRHRFEEVDLKGAWTGPASLQLAPHALARVADLPVLEIVEARHLLTDLTFGCGESVFDYLDQPPIVFPRSRRGAREAAKSSAHGSARPATRER
jgi:acetoacetate decarboxylase